MNNNKSNKLARYYKAIDALPSVRGTGNYNAKISSVTAHAINLGLSVAEVKQDLQSRGRGCYQQHEIENAYRSSQRNGFVVWDFDTEFCRPQPLFNGKYSSVIKPTITRKVIAIDSEEIAMELIEHSPYRLIDNPCNDFLLVLKYGFTPEEYVFIGDTYDTTVFKVSEVLNHKHTVIDKPFTCINPFTGLRSETNNGKLSYRAESSISHVRYMLIEMDDTSIEKQVGFWLEQIKKLPVFVIIDSGKKSLHAWIRVDCTPTEWDITRNKVFDVFSSYGIDKACKNKSRLSRTAGHYRNGGRQQCLLYLNPNCGAV